MFLSLSPVAELPAFPFSLSVFRVLGNSNQLWLQRLIYFIGNLLALALAVYNCQAMGLLPTHTSDWLAFIQPPKVRSALGTWGGSQENRKRGRSFRAVDPERLSRTSPILSGV